MAAYKDLVGQKITKVTSNPGEPKTGQMWYNSTDGKLRGLGILEAWASTSLYFNQEILQEQLEHKQQLWFLVEEMK